MSKALIHKHGRKKEFNLDLKAFILTSHIAAKCCFTVFSLNSGLH